MSARVDERTQFVDASGRPITGGSLYIGIVDLDPVLNPKNIYSDRELTTQIANPQTLDSFGRAANKIWLDGKYSMRVNDSSGNQVLQDLDAGDIAEIGNTVLSDVLGANTITANASNTITSYVDGQTYIFTVNATNAGGGVTLNIDNLGAKNIQKNYVEPLEAGDFLASYEVIVVYNAENDVFQWANATDTKFPVDYLTGGKLTRNSISFQEFNVESGFAANSTNRTLITLPDFSKDADSPFIEGSGNGALVEPSGTLIANSAYDIYAVFNPTSDTTDYICDLVANGTTNLPTGYTLFRNLGRFFTDADLNILIEILDINSDGLPANYLDGGKMSIGYDIANVVSVAVGGVFTHDGTFTFDIGDLVTLSGFTTNLNYNGTFVVTASTATTVTCPEVAFGTTETGTINLRNVSKIYSSPIVCRDDNNSVDMVGPAMQKDISASWVAGDGNGGLFNGTVAADTTYYYFVIRNDANGILDAGYDTDINADNIPNGYTAHKMLSNVRTNSSSELIDSMQGVFNSGPQTVVSAGPLSLPHGLQTSEITIEARLHVITADEGYDAGSIIPIDIGRLGSTSVNGGVGLRHNSELIEARYSDNSSVFTVVDFTTGAATGTFANAAVRYLIKARVRKD